MESNAAAYNISKLQMRSEDLYLQERTTLKSTDNMYDRRVALDFLAGCLGGCVGVLVSHPLDTVKVHLQTQNAFKPKYRGTWHCLTSLAKHEGVPALYRGITSPICGIGFINAIVFGIYGNVQRSLGDPEALISHTMAGGVAGVCQSVVCAPIELAKTRLQLQHHDSATHFKSPLDFLKNVIKTQGIRGPMRGFVFTALRDIPGFASYFLSYEYLMRLPFSSNVIYCLYAGGIAGCCSWVLTYPLDVVKTCIQADDPRNPQFKSYADCITQSYKAGGGRFFFRGMLSTMIRSFPMNAACFFTVAQVNRWGQQVF